MLTLSNALEKAVKNAIVLQNAIYHGDYQTLEPLIKHKQRIMQNTLDSTWETTPKTKWVKDPNNHNQWIEKKNEELSPIRQIYLVYAEAFRRREWRGTIPGGLEYKKLTSLNL